MLKKSLIAIAVLALAMPAFAGSLKVHEWGTTCDYVEYDICTIDVLINVGYYIVVENQDAVTLTQTESTNNYSGVYTSNVSSNFAATLSASIAAATGVSIDTLTAVIDDPDIEIGDNVINVTITANGVNIEDLAREDGVKIADMTISVKPAA